MLYLLAEWFS